MSDDLCLHKAVFDGDIKVIEKILENIEEKRLNSQDIHGNTALHIATMKGNKRCVELLIEKGAVTTIRNELNWMCLHEAISYGNFDIIKIINDALSQRVIKYLKRDYIFKACNEIKEDFVLNFEVRLKDYKPTTITGHPEAEIQLTKKGLKIRADILTMDSFHVRPQNFHLIFDVNPNSESFIKVMIGGLPFYQNMTFDNWEQIMTDIFGRESSNEEIIELMRKETVCIKLDWSSKPKDCPSFRKVLTRNVAGHQSNIFESQGVNFITKTRTEHLTAREEANSTPNETNRRPNSLPEPTARDVSWQQYMNAPKANFPYLGRKLIETIETNRVSVVIGLSEEIPTEWKWVLKCAEYVFNNKFATFVSQLSNQLPEGFPVCADMPLKASLYIKWKLISFEKSPDIDDSIFNIPSEFAEREIFSIERITP